MHYSENTKWIFDNGLRPCEAVIINWETMVEKVCGEKTVAVYVSGDSRKIFKPICKAHRDASRAGDGPVYDLVPVVDTKSVEELVNETR